jgi:hypothetical protein
MTRLLRRGAIADAYTSAVSLPSDNFNRADAATLGTSSSGHTWDEHGTAWSIASNRCVPPSSGGYRFVTLPAGQADVTVTATINPAASPDLGLCARVVDTNNLVFFDLDWVTDHWICRVFQRLGGSFTGLTSLVDPVAGLADNTTPFTAALTVTGATGGATINGASQGTWTGLDSSLLTATAHGLVGNDITASTFDNFAIT